MFYTGCSVNLANSESCKGTSRWTKVAMGLGVATHVV